MSTRPASRALTAVALLAVSALLAAGCSSPRRHAGPAPASGAVITVDRWAPPALTGPPSNAQFCLALTAVYRHMADLTRVISAPVTARYLTDYVTFAPSAVAVAPPAVHPAAALYMGAVASYLRAFVRAGLDLNRLPAGSLAQLASPTVNAAYTTLAGYSQTECHYAIGGTPTQS